MRTRYGHGIGQMEHGCRKGCHGKKGKNKRMKRGKVKGKRMKRGRGKGKKMKRGRDNGVKN